MSRAVSDHLTWHLHSVGVDLKATKRAGAMAQRLVLAALCAHADSSGCAWPSQSRIAEREQMSRQTVQDSLTALEEQGHIQRVNPQAKRGALIRWRVLPVVLADLFAREPDGQVDGQVDGLVDGLARHEGEEEVNNPPTPRKVTRSQQADRPRGRGKEWGDRHEAVFALVSERERTRTRGEVGPGLVKHWRRDYEQPIRDALVENPGRSDDDIARHLVSLRYGSSPPPAPAPQPQANCPTCQGRGWWGEKTPTGTQHHTCDCATDEGTPKRVTAERAPNTDSPAPPAPADPRSGLRRVV